MQMSTVYIIISLTVFLFIIIRIRGNYGMYNYYGSNYDIRNNIFAGNTYAIYDRLGTNVHYDYNVYNSAGFYLAYTGSFYSSLSAWQSVDSTQNMNSC